MDPTEPRYTLRDLDSAISNLPEGILQMWIARGVLKLGDTAPGRGKKRMFSFSEAVQVHIMAFLTASGDPSKTAATVGKIVADFMCKWLEDGKALDYSYVDDEHYPILIFSKSGVDRIKSKFVPKNSMSYETLNSTYCSVLDFFYSMTGFYDNLELARKYSLARGDRRGA